jgi:catechol 2,3-dioxygenase-like lactoylglutathione lyase family enzyme
MAVIERLDFLGVPTQDPERSRAFYRGVLGLRPDEHAEWEQWAGDTCFGIWEPARFGGEFRPQPNGIALFHVVDVAAARAELEAKGVVFEGETFDTGVCNMATFADPDGNQLVLHNRYAPYGDNAAR